MTSSGDAPDELSTNNDRAHQTSLNKRSTRAEAQNGSDTRRLSSPPQSLKRASTTPLPPTSSSTVTSPQLSRDTSPIRPPVKPGIPPGSRLSRSRKSSQDLSPHRAPNVSVPATAGVLSAAAVQRALSVAGTHRLPSPTTSDFSIDAPRPQISSKAQSNPACLARGPLPPRLKSPPVLPTPHRSSIYSPRRPDYAPLTPSIVVDRATPTSVSSLEGAPEDPDIMIRSGVRTPVKVSSGNAALETVQESSLPTESAPQMGLAQQGNQFDDKERVLTIEEDLIDGAVSKASRTPAESGSESGGNRSARAKSHAKEIRKLSTVQVAHRPPNVNPKKSLSQLNSTKAKVAGEGSVKNMTVETETVSSVPQVAVGGGASDRGITGRIDANGSIRLKPSNETIRPKKERRKTVRKAPSINSGTGGSSSYSHHHHKYARAAAPEASFSGNAASSNFVAASYSLYSNDMLDTARSRSVAQPASLVINSYSHISLKRNSSTVLTNSRDRTASSKADIFEAKVASAVDEANSSDSEETFVYESNPLEPLSSRPNRYHSRTPSATSMASQLDHHGGRYRQDGHHSITGKKSMKFSSNSHHALHGNPMENSHNGTNVSGRGSGGNISHHHIGRYGRGATGHTSLFDNESPFPNTGKPLRTSMSNGSRLSPRPATPRTPHLLRIPGTSGKSSAPLYDLEGEGADDERTPLMGSTRSGRNRNSRRPPNRLQNYGEDKSGGLCKRLTGWIVLGGVVALLVAIVVIGLILCSKPLYEVRVKSIQNVLASEQELIFDLHVHAINPNLVAIQVTDLGIDVFAKSKYVSSSRYSWYSEMSSGSDNPDQEGSVADRTGSPMLRSWETVPANNWVKGGVDEGNDPIEDPEGDHQYQLLGRILEFDSPLIFDASPLRHESLSSIGEVRLARPGNHTKGVSTWWEKVIHHPFELKVRGPLRYSLPISSRLRSASINGNVTVKPEVPIDDGPEQT